jgi:hypothetical protein
MIFAPLGLLLAANVNVVDAWKPKSTPTALATVTPCPSPVAWGAPAPITVTSQYQAVSTCQPVSEICIKNSCWMHYSYSTYDFVSTVIPYPSASPTTITKTDQSVFVSKASETITNTLVTSTVKRRGWKRPITVTSTSFSYTTVVKEWSAAYKDLGPLAIPGYGGSGICTKCHGPGEQKLQALDVLECFGTSDKPTVCRTYPEAWIFGSLPHLARTESAACATHTSVTAAGVYVFKFPQHVPPRTFNVPPRTVTYTIDGPVPRVITSTTTATTTIFPGRDWAATVTRRCAQPTVIDFEVIVTKVIEYDIPPFVFPNGPWVNPPQKKPFCLLLLDISSCLGSDLMLTSTSTASVAPPATWSDWAEGSTTISAATSTSSSVWATLSSTTSTGESLQHTWDFRL